MEKKIMNRVVKELGDTEAHIVVEIVEYVPNSIVTKTIIKKTPGSVTISSFDEGEELAENSSPFDCYMQVIDGEADIIMNNKTHRLRLGDGIIVHANVRHQIRASIKFKIISSCIQPFELVQPGT